MNDYNIVTINLSPSCTLITYSDYLAHYKFYMCACRLMYRVNLGLSFSGLVTYGCVIGYGGPGRPGVCGGVLDAHVLIHARFDIEFKIEFDTSLTLGSSGWVEVVTHRLTQYIITMLLQTYHPLVCLSFTSSTCVRNLVQNLQGGLYLVGYQLWWARQI